MVARKMPSEVVANRSTAAPAGTGDRALDRHGQSPCTTASDERARDQHHQRHRPHLADHDFQRRHRHHQQMLDGAMLALADQRRAGEDDGQQGHLIDDLDDGAEPRLVGDGLKRTRSARSTGNTVSAR